MTTTDDNATIARGAEVCLAVDFGAGSGRVIAGQRLDDGTLRLQELHRFANRPVKLMHTLHWDFPGLYMQMCDGIRKATDMGLRVLSVGIDTWGVDFGLVTAGGALVGNPLTYRDSHTQGLPERLWSTRTERIAHYGKCGVLPQEINTLYQLVAMRQREPELLMAANKLLFMPDLFAYYLTGQASCELTIASTSELLIAGKAEWDRGLIDKLGLPQRLFGPIVPPGTVKGQFLPEVATSLGLDTDSVVVAVGSHDTASAVYASSALHEDPAQAFLSSGTWSLLGRELASPVCTPQAHDQGYTNEAGVGGRVCLLQNIPGMWALQNMVSKWESQGCFPGYDELMARAEEADIDTIIDVDDPALVQPQNMEQAIADICRDNGQKVPHTPAEYARVAVRSLAARYGKAIEAMNAVLPAQERPRSINVVGGGCRNHYLNRLTAEATGLPVVAGPVEATAIGNLMLQFATLEHSEH